MGRWLPLPKEHGAWAQAVLVTGSSLLVAPHLGLGLLMGVGALWALFLAHEPLLLSLGHRGGRVRESASHPRAWTFGLGAVAAGLGWGAFRPTFFAPFWSLGITLAFALLWLPTMAWGREKTLSGELLAALSLGSYALPLTLRGGASLESAGTLAGGLMLDFALGILLVRSHLGRWRKRKERLPGAAAVGLVLISTGLAVGFLLQGRALLGLSFLPLPMAAIQRWRVPWQPHRLRALGWVLALAMGGAALMRAWALR